MLNVNVYGHKIDHKGVSEISGTLEIVDSTTIIDDESGSGSGKTHSLKE